MLAVTVKSFEKNTVLSKLCKGCVKLVNRGEDQLREVQDKTLNQDMTYDYRYMFQMGVGVIINLIFGEWVIA